MKKMLSILISAACLAALLCMPVFAENEDFLSKIQGSFIELFPEFAKEEFHDYWIECISKYEADPDMAEVFYQMLVGACMGKLRGQEAIDFYSKNPESVVFDCFFEDGVAKITIKKKVLKKLKVGKKVKIQVSYGKKTAKQKVKVKKQGFTTPIIFYFF